MHLKQLEKEGFIECVEGKRSLIMVRWRLTEKGRHTLPILIQLVAFGSKWYFDIVFEDKKPRKLTGIFSQPEGEKLSQA